MGVWEGRGESNIAREVDYRAPKARVRGSAIHMVDYQYMPMRRSRQLNINILNLFSNSCIIGVLKFCLCAWGGNLRCSEKILIERVLKRVNKITKRTDFNTIFSTVCQAFLSKIIKDSTHPLFKEIHFSKLRSNRLLHLQASTKRYADSCMFQMMHFCPM